MGAALVLTGLGAVTACKSQAADNGPPLPSVPCADKAWSDEVCILGGVFIMGHDPLPWTRPDCKNTAPPGGNSCGPGNPPLNDFAPPHEVELNPFFIDTYAATNAEYKACFDAGMCPDERYRGPVLSFKSAKLSSYPVATIAFEGAEAYCHWKSKRLPTEAEWERAARGPRATDYPWGNEAPDCTRYRCDASAVGWRLYPVGSIPGDVSPEGAREMVSNAAEIVHDVWDPTYYARSPRLNPQGPGEHGILISNVLRGNAVLIGLESPFSYDGVSFPLPAWTRGRTYAGVRCARDGTGNGTSEALAKFRRSISSGTSSGGKR